ncbi:MAG: hypothetical protein KAS32_25210 [Candidatus Peribacteraceae bacterium]|nr:hypothetical protein [Candidatus Peribacteraceae bacterium]
MGAYTRAYTPAATGGVTGADQTALNNSSYVPTLYAKKVLFDFYKQTVFKEICNTNYEGDFKNMGDTINIRQAPVIATGTYHPGGGTALAYQVPLDDDITMNIDQSLYTAFKIDDVDKLQTDVDLLNMYTTDSAQRLSIATDTDVLSAAVLATGADAANKGATAGLVSTDLDFGTDALYATTVGPLQITSSNTEVAASNTYNATNMLVRAGQALDEQNIPQADRWVVAPAWFISKLKFSDLKAANITGDSTGVIRTGLVGEVNGMKIYQNNSLPKGATALASHYIYAGTRAACSFALQMSKSESGKLENYFGDYFRTLWVYGRKVIRGEALVAIIANDANGSPTTA